MACPYWCYECSSPTVCLTWNSDYGYIDDGTGTNYTCDLANGYGFDGIYCVYCSSAMKGCTNCTSKSVCTACDPTLSLLADSSGCGCGPTSYYDPLQYICVSCSGCCPEGQTYNTLTSACEPCSSFMPGCDKCNSTSFCLSCFYGYFRNWTSGSCSLCSDAMPGCLACDDASYCNTCDSLNNYYLDPWSEVCQCNPPYYQDSGVCNLPCDSVYAGCMRCFNSYNCYSCNASLGLLPGEGDCYCRYGVWNGTGCGFCSVGVPNCTNACYLDTWTGPTNYTVCNGCTWPYTLTGNACICPSPQFIESNNMCITCSEKFNGCLECDISLGCTLCDTSSGYILNTFTNLCECDIANNWIFTAGYCSLAPITCLPGNYFNGLGCGSC